MTQAIEYALEPDLSVTDFVRILDRSTLAQRRPTDELKRIEGMLRNADVIVTARQNTDIVGVARAITDFHYCTYLSDLAVDTNFQRQGIGKELIARCHQAAGLSTTLILLSAPAAQSYYPHIGMQPHNSCWTRPSQSQ